MTSWNMHALNVFISCHLNRVPRQQRQSPLLSGLLNLDNNNISLDLLSPVKYNALTT